MGYGFHEAIIAGNILALVGLLGLGEDPNQTDIEGRTPLHYCGVYKNAECAETLLRAGARVDVADVHGNEPLWTAVYEARGAYGVVAALVAAGADPEHKNKFGRSPKMFAEQIGDSALLALLLRNG